MVAREWGNFLNSRRLHESTKRSLCRVAFVFGAVFPLLLTVAACVAEYVPRYQRARASGYQHRLSAALGCSLELAAVELRSPSCRLLHGVKLRDPETGNTLARAQSVMMSEGVDGTLWQFNKAEIVVEQMGRLYGLLHESYLCRPPAAGQLSEAVFDGLLFRDGSNNRLLKLARIKVQRMPNETQSSIVFALEGMTGQPASIAFVRKHLEPEPVSHVRLTTGDQRIPGRWLACFSPQWIRGGEASTLTGQFELAFNQHRWSLAGSGMVRDLDVSEWTARPLLSGLASLRLEALSISNGRIDQVSAGLRIEHGRVHDDLLKAVDYIGIKPTPEIANSTSAAHPFEQIAVDFDLDSRGLQIRAAMENHAIAADAHGAIARQYFDKVVPLDNMVTAHSVALQEAPSLRRLAQWLPLPVVSSNATASQSNHQANTSIQR